MRKPGKQPDSVNETDEIVRIIKSSGFSVLAQRRVKLSPEQVSDFYAEHYGKVNISIRFSSLESNCILVNNKCRK